MRGLPHSDMCSAICIHAIVMNGEMAAQASPSPLSMAGSRCSSEMGKNLLHAVTALMCILHGVSPQSQPESSEKL